MSKVCLIGRDEDYKELFKRQFDTQNDMNIFIYNQVEKFFPKTKYLNILYSYSLDYYKFMNGKRCKHKWNVVKNLNKEFDDDRKVAQEKQESH